VNFVIGLLLLTAAAATNTPPAQAEKTPVAAADRIPVFLHTDARDTVGATCVARLREALEESSAYSPVMNPASARFVVSIVTMDPNEAELGSGPGHATVAAVTLQGEHATGLNQFVYSWVLVARQHTVDSLATELFTAIDEQIQRFEGAAISVAEPRLGRRTAVTFPLLPPPQKN
jgi:hypothetical protein